MTDDQAKVVSIEDARALRDDYCETTMSAQMMTGYVDRIVQLAESWPERRGQAVQFGATINGMIVGPAGCGKSRFALHYAARLDRRPWLERGFLRYGAVVAEAPHLPRSGRGRRRGYRASERPVLERLYASIKGYSARDGAGGRSQPVHVLEDRITESLAGKPRMVFMDEAQMLDEDSLDMLRCIADRSGCPFVFLGNELALEGEASVSAQFTSRIAGGIRIDPRVMAVDVLELCRHHGVLSPVTAWLERRPELKKGGWRQVEMLLRLAGGPKARLDDVQRQAMCMGWPE